MVQQQTIVMKTSDISSAFNEKTEEYQQTNFDLLVLDFENSLGEGSQILQKLFVSDNENIIAVILYIEKEELKKSLIQPVELKGISGNDLQS